MDRLTLHEQAVDRLIASLDHMEPDEPIRLAKKTSNLFRPREDSEAKLDVADLDGVISVDVHGMTADVQGMCTYERLVDETLALGLIPTVVPQLRTITIGGAVTGLGIESTSLRLGLPHEAVREMDIVTGAGKLVTATPDNEHAELFAVFPNSYGSLGYALRLRIDLQPATRQVQLRHVRAGSARKASQIISEVAETGEFEGVRVDAIDGTAFTPGDVYVTLAEFTDSDGPVSDYTGDAIYYQSIRERSHDTLTMYDYLWRWDTDWFWCSAAFGAQNPVVRKIWPTRLRRSDVYHRLVGLDTTIGVSRILDRIKRVPGRERVIQDVEVPLNEMGEFLSWFDAEVGMRPVWICPLRTRREWPSYGLTPDQIYVNIGFWGTVEVPAWSPPGAVNRKIEAKVSELGGHKSLYSESFYSEAEFGTLYGTAELDRLRSIYDPKGRLRTLYDKTVRNA